MASSLLAQLDDIATLLDDGSLYRSQLTGGSGLRRAKRAFGRSIHAVVGILAGIAVLLAVLVFQKLHGKTGAKPA